jgi:hypothetical protein
MRCEHRRERHPRDWWRRFVIAAGVIAAIAAGMRWWRPPNRAVALSLFGLGHKQANWKPAGPSRRFKRTRRGHWRCGLNQSAKRQGLKLVARGSVLDPHVSRTGARWRSKPGTGIQAHQG